MIFSSTPDPMYLHQQEAGVRCCWLTAPLLYPLHSHKSGYKGQRSRGSHTQNQTPNTPVNALWCTSAQGDGVIMSVITLAESLSYTVKDLSDRQTEDMHSRDDSSPKLPIVCGPACEDVRLILVQKLCQACALNPDSWGLSHSTIPCVPITEGDTGDPSPQLRWPRQREAKRSVQNPASQGTELCLQDLQHSVAFRFQFYPVLHEGECWKRGKGCCDHHEPPQSVSQDEVGGRQRWHCLEMLAPGVFVLSKKRLVTLLDGHSIPHG